MARQGYDLQLTRYDEQGWRATFYMSGMEHSPTSATGTAWEPTPWRAVQGAAWEALTKPAGGGMKRTVVSLLLALVVAGCATTGKEMLMSRGLAEPVRYFSTSAYDVSRTHDPQGIISVDTIMCEPVTRLGFWHPIYNPMYGSCPPTRVRITNDPKDEEAWATETRWAPRGATDARLGNLPSGIAFMSRERCEAFRAEHPTYTKPHEVCEVIHFKRLSPRQ